MAKNIRISIYQMPDLMFKLRQEMADLLRAEAGADTNPDFARKLRELAATFETGATGVDGRQVRRTHGRP